MNFNLPWVKDPKDGSASVSLTMLAVSFIAVLIAAGLQMADVIKDTSVVLELFYGNLALYFGRRFSVNNKNFSSDNSQSPPPG
jgi:enamine deaminase RidA (YjgF/YER057c/UK114 family)